MNNQERDSFEELNIDDILRDFHEEEDSRTDKDTIRQSVKSDRSTKQPEKGTWQKNLLMYLHDFVFLLAAVMLLFLLCFRVVVVSGESMNDTLYDGDYLLLLGNVFYQEPKAGDIIVASKESFDNGAPIVKRVIATEGQTVDIDFTAGIVYVDGEALVEPYIQEPTTLFEGVQFPLTVDDGCLFVMGDNRGDSKDSRNPEIGLIDRREVLGKVIFLFLPGTNGGEYEKDYNRIGVVS